MNQIITSSVILIAQTEISNRYVFGAYNSNNEAVAFIKLPEDHQFFVNELTGEQTVIGFNTLMATPDDFPDDGRICITHHPKKIGENAIPATSIEEGIEIAKKRAVGRNKDRIYVIGGSSIIQQCLEKNLLDEIKLTVVKNYFDEAEYFVYLDFDLNQWKIKEDSGWLVSTDSKPENLEYRFYTLKK